ncbi:MAG: response regulator transcription factor [Dehalococcoidales bacterium]|nr:response regulator transcription factor [Dehalococcoidales bacterium]
MNVIKVLIADDHVTFSEGLQRVLSEEPGMEVAGVARDGQQAVSMAGELKPDIVIMDIAMPVLNGIEATRQIKQILPTTAVLVLTAYGYAPYVFSVLEAGAGGYLLKSVPMRELIRAIQALLNGESVFDQAVAEKALKSLVKSWRGGLSSTNQLKPRELEVIRLGARGLSNEEIAEKLYISPRTVQTHFTHIFTKLAVGSRLEAILRCLKEGWIMLDDLP